MQNLFRQVWVSVFVLALTLGLAPGGTSAALAQDQSLLGDDLRTGRCKKPGPYVLAVHGGTARKPNSYEGSTAFMARLLEEAGAALEAGAASVDLVHNAVRAMEDSGLFNAGQGARANQAGVIEMDASIMDGKRQNAGAVASVKTVKNPITAAKLVMQRTPQVMLVGPDAEAYVAKNRGAIVEPGYFRLSGLNFDDVPFPEDVTITAPAADLAAELTGFSGIWGGVFGGAITVLVAVEEVTADGARVVFGHGVAQDWNVHGGQSARYDAELANGALRLTLHQPREGQLDLRLGADGGLEATYNAKGLGRMTTSLTRFESVPRPEKHGTVGAVALDRCGNLAAGTSTGGFGSKVPGRVGDSPIIGAGTYANNKTAAISATGHGEFFMRFVAAYDIAAQMEYGGLSLEEAADATINGKLKAAKGSGGVIAVDAAGNVTAACNTDGMVRGVVTHQAPPKVEVY